MGHGNDVPDFVFTHEGDYLVSVSNDGTMRLWDPHGAEEVFSRLMARRDSARNLVRYQFNRVAAPSLGAFDSRGTQQRIRIATVGAEPEPEPGAPPAETLVLWDIATREQPDMPKARTEDTSRALLQLARDRRLEPQILTDQAPSCR